MTSAQKKVIVRQLGGERVSGYLSSAGFVRDGSVDVLGLDGKTISILLRDIRTIAYVRDFGSSRTNPEGLVRTAFAGRPRTPGLWLRLTFREGGEILEGIADVHLGALEEIAADGGISIAPPDLRGNSQRLFIPNSALSAVEILGWIAGPKKASEAKANLSGELFPSDAA